MVEQPKPKQAKRWQVAVAIAALSAFLIWMGWKSMQPAPIRSKASAGVTPIHYYVEEGPLEGQLEDMKAKGLVPQDAIDNGAGRFVSPSTLTPDELALAKQVEERRARWRARRAARGGASR